MKRYWIYKDNRLVGARVMSWRLAKALKKAGYVVQLVSGSG
jgi:hypothetical protein